MDKREVLRRLDQLHFEMTIKEDKLRKHYKEQYDYTTLYCYYLGKISGVRWARRELEKVRSVIAHIDESPEVTEMCPSCGH
nr:MAG TPA: TFIIB zinc-binding [Caudoviricetes sp.]